MAEYNKSRFYWIKLTDRFMTSDTVDFLMEQKDGANYVVLYQMLCLKTVNQNGELARTLGEIIVPYDAEKIQRDMKWFSIDTVRVALELYKKLGLIYEQENGTLKITDFEKMIGSQTISAYKKQEQIASRGGIKVEKIPPYIDIDKDIDKDIDIKESKEKSFDTHGFETFVKKYNINLDNYSANLYDLDFERLDNAFSESDFLKENFISLSKICREYQHIIGGYYKDFTKPKGKSVPKTETDREFLLRKQYSEEYVDSLSAEELKAKAKRLRGE